MMRFWRSLAGDATLDPAARLPTLESVEQLLQQRATAGKAA